MTTVLLATLSLVIKNGFLFNNPDIQWLNPREEAEVVAKWAQFKRKVLFCVQRNFENINLLWADFKWSFYWCRLLVLNLTECMQSWVKNVKHWLIENKSFYSKITQNHIQLDRSKNWIEVNFFHIQLTILTLYHSIIIFSNQWHISSIGDIRFISL